LAEVGDRRREMKVAKHFVAEQRSDLTKIRLGNPAFFDTAQYAELQNELAEFVEEQGPGRLLVDLSVVEYCSTAVMNALLIAKERLESKGGLMIIFGVNDTVRGAFQRLNLDGTVFNICTTEDEAMDAI
jgi:anti-anti-sigma regulatory factor